MTPQERDLGLLLRVQAREEPALAALFDAHGGLVYGVALRILGSAGDAEDVTQEAWLQVWNQASRYDPRRASVAGWLLTVARSRALDKLRSRNARRRAEDDARRDTQMAASGPDPHSESSQSELQTKLAAALASLHPDHRQVLELAYFAGLSQSEIAARLERPLGTVKSWSRQGLMQLRALVPREHWT